MSFAEAIRTCFQKYLTISGRARRSEYWWWVLFLFLGNMAAGFIDNLAFSAGPDGPSLLAPLFSLAVLLPSICVAGRRLHDRDMSAWWLLLMLVPLIGSLILLVLYVLPGTKGDNRFGPDPLGPDTGFGPDRDTGSYSRSSIPRVDRDHE